MTRHLTPATATFIGAAGNKLIADVFGDGGSPVLLLHGGGQTRHAWHKTAQEIARKGHTAYALDQRGHGDSDWVVSGAYEFADYAADAKVVAAELTRRSGARPIAIGASLGLAKASPNATRVPASFPRWCSSTSPRAWT